MVLLTPSECIVVHQNVLNGHATKAILLVQNGLGQHEMSRVALLPANVDAPQEYQERDRMEQINKLNEYGGEEYECLFHVIWQSDTTCTFALSFAGEPGNYVVQYATSSGDTSATEEQYLDVGWPMTWTVSDCAEYGHTHILKDGKNLYGDGNYFKVLHFEGNPDGGYYRATEE
ncbi:hypothetical protein EMPS_01648 [Entomortierella parvispora]|uniref:Uncharacterized protein n=1 Tax=Entomortierella parvispora TaxID=205924 RepID=A0A9P3H3Y9_9FUNG|nr:hypothetical protein EMPS_01648 [Entomortierella parvispora]